MKAKIPLKKRTYTWNVIVTNTKLKRCESIIINYSFVRLFWEPVLIEKRLHIFMQLSKE